MLSDREYLEQRLELFVSDPWQTFKSELISFIVLIKDSRCQPAVFFCLSLIVLFLQ